MLCKAETFELFMSHVWSGGPLYDSWHDANLAAKELFSADLSTPEESILAQKGPDTILLTFSDGSSILSVDSGAGLNDLEY